MIDAHVLRKGWNRSTTACNRPLSRPLHVAGGWAAQPRDRASVAPTVRGHPNHVYCARRDRPCNRTTLAACRWQCRHDAERSGHQAHTFTDAGDAHGSGCCLPTLAGHTITPAATGVERLRAPLVRRHVRAGSAGTTNESANRRHDTDDDGRAWERRRLPSLARWPPTRPRPPPVIVAFVSPRRVQPSGGDTTMSGRTTSATVTDDRDERVVRLLHPPVAGHPDHVHRDQRGESP